MLLCRDSPGDVRVIFVVRPERGCLDTGRRQHRFPPNCGVASMTEIDRIRRAHAEAQPDATHNPAWANCHRDCGILLEEIKTLQVDIAAADEECGKIVYPCTYPGCNEPDGRKCRHWPRS